MREKVFSIKENYDKKFEELFMQFKNIESLFLQGYFEQETLGDIKNSKHKQKEIVVIPSSKNNSKSHLSELFSYLSNCKIINIKFNAAKRFKTK